MRWKFLLPVLVLIGAIWLVGSVTSQPLKGVATDKDSRPTTDIDSSISRVDAFFQKRWADERLAPAKVADDLTVLRRITLTLMGTVPSLEEIRAFEADSGPDRLRRWTARYLHDARFADYFAERLARAFVGVEGGQFLVYRRDRFNAWLREQLLANRPYQEIVREMIVGSGLATDRPESNFVMAGYDDGEGFDENKLAGRAVRAFLGQRIDCAQCHDHPFANWKQHDFAGLAAHFGQLRLSAIGVRDDRDLNFEIEDRKTLEKKVVNPSVPFGPAWEPAEGNRREQLAAWITHPQNRRFERAIVNRVWGLVFGRAWIDPVDDLPDPPGDEFVSKADEAKSAKTTATSAESNDPPIAANERYAELLDLVGADFREHGYDLRRLIEVLVASQPFRLESRLDHEPDDPQALDRLKSQFAMFPISRLRPEQMIGSMLQASSLKTIDQNSHLIPRTIKFFRSQDFVREYGDLGENELEDRAGTIPQALLRMNGDFAKDTLEAGPFSGTGRLTSMSPDDKSCLDLCFLICLTRRPTSDESQHFLPLLKDTKRNKRANVVEDIFWTLFNSPEFAWNH